MGWCCDDSRHEGYVIGMVPRDFPRERAGACSVLSSQGSRFHSTDEWPLRELGAGGVVSVGLEGGEESRGDVHNISLVHVTCSCGWRSPLQLAPESEWFPSVTCMRPEYEDAARELWQDHVAGKSISTSEILSRAGRYRLERSARANVHELSIARSARALREGP